jgi:hypothetical protein
MILERLWGTTFEPLINLVDVHTSCLRYKLDQGFQLKLIQTIRGIGYCLSSGTGKKPPMKGIQLGLIGNPQTAGDKAAPCKCSLNGPSGFFHIPVAWIRAKPTDSVARLSSLVPGTGSREEKLLT